MQLGLIESKPAIEGRQMIMMLGPNKAAVAKLQATTQSITNKPKNKKQDNENPSSETALSEELETALNEEPETASVAVET